MYGLEANGFGSMLREGGIPPLLGPEYGDVLGDSHDSDDSDDEENYYSPDKPHERGLKKSGKWQKKFEGEQQVKASAAARKTNPASHPKESTSAQPPDEIQKSRDGTDHASSTAKDKSTDARNRGNDLYRKGLFDEATKAYFEALSLTPNDSAPLSNLSAVRFELGDYPGATMYAEKALKLLSNEADSHPKKQKLLSRLARAQILQLQGAAPLISRLETSDTARNSATIKHGSNRESVTWTKLLDEIPRYRPML